MLCYTYQESCTFSTTVEGKRVLYTCSRFLRLSSVEVCTSNLGGILEGQFIFPHMHDYSTLEPIVFSPIAIKYGNVPCFIIYRFGAGIKIDVITPSTVYNQLAANPQCPFLYEDTSAIPENWTEVCNVTIGMVLWKSL